MKNTESMKHRKNCVESGDIFSVKKSNNKLLGVDTNKTIKAAKRRCSLEKGMLKDGISKRFERSMGIDRTRLSKIVGLFQG